MNWNNNYQIGFLQGSKGQMPPATLNDVNTRTWGEESLIATIRTLRYTTGKLGTLSPDKGAASSKKFPFDDVNDSGPTTPADYDPVAAYLKKDRKDPFGRKQDLGRIPGFDPQTKDDDRDSILEQFSIREKKDSFGDMHQDFNIFPDMHQDFNTFPEKELPFYDIPRKKEPSLDDTIQEFLTKYYTNDTKIGHGLHARQSEPIHDRTGQNPLILDEDSLRSVAEAAFEMEQYRATRFRDGYLDGLNIFIARKKIKHSILSVRGTNGLKDYMSLDAFRKGMRSVDSLVGRSDEKQFGTAKEDFIDLDFSRSMDHNLEQLKHHNFSKFMEGYSSPYEQLGFMVAIARDYNVTLESWQTPTTDASKKAFKDGMSAVGKDIGDLTKRMVELMLGRLELTPNYVIEPIVEPAFKDICGVGMEEIGAYVGGLKVWLEKEYGMDNDVDAISLLHPDVLAGFKEEMAKAKEYEGQPEGKTRIGGEEFYALFEIPTKTRFDHQALCEALRRETWEELGIGHYKEPLINKELLPDQPFYLLNKQKLNLEADHIKPLGVDRDITRLIHQKHSFAEQLIRPLNPMDPSSTDYKQQGRDIARKAIEGSNRYK